MTLKDIKKLIAIGQAEDITKLSSDMINVYDAIEQGFEVIEVSKGVYGMNGALLKGRTSNNLYAITSRSSNLFRLV
jgi:hypothetical protein